MGSPRVFEYEYRFPKGVEAVGEKTWSPSRRSADHRTGVCDTDLSCRRRVLRVRGVSRIGGEM